MCDFESYYGVYVLKFGLTQQTRTRISYLLEGIDHGVATALTSVVKAIVNVSLLFQLHSR